MTKLFFFVLPVFLMISACKSKPASLAGDDEVESSDFFSSYSDLELPYTVADTTINKKDNDSSLISYTVFTQFVPDTVLNRLVGKGKPKIYPVGKITVAEDEIYLISKTVLNKKKGMMLTVFDGDLQFVKAMPLLIVDQGTRTQQSSTIDSRYTINKSITRRNADNTVEEGKEVYVYNKEGKDFTLIMTDALDDGNGELINPLDTLPREHRHSADYVKDKRNIVSIRDANSEDRFEFFIHFEKSKGECTGELKGFALYTDDNHAIYRQPGDPCILEFSFGKNSVTLKEVEGCGNRRGLKCSFNDTYSKKKETSAAKK